MTLYRIEEGRKATHICIEAEIVNHTDWAALHILHTKAEALKIVEWYMDNAGYSWIGTNCRRYGWTVNSDCSICYHIPGKGWTCLSEGEPVKMSDLRKADAIQASGADDEMAWAAVPERVTVYLLDGDSLCVDIDAGELADDCEAVNVADLEERTEKALHIIRIQPTAQTAEQTAERCAQYTRHALRYSPELADKALAAIADPANNGRWTDADSVTDIVWPICNAIENPAQRPKEAPTTAPVTEAEQQPTETENAPQTATQAAEEPTTDEKKEEENTMSTTTTKPTTTPEAAAILAINPAIFKGLHIKLGFDFQQPVTIRRIPAPFTIKKAWKLAGADHDPTTSTAAIIMRDTGNTWSIYRDMHMAPITADNLRDDYNDHGMSYSHGRAHGYKTVFSTFFAKGSFHDLRKSPTCEAWIIAQHNDLLKPWTKPARDWTERQRDMAPGEHPQPCRVYYGNNRPVYLIDKSNYRIDARREDLKRRAAKLRADRQKAAADAATAATAARRFNDLLTAFSAAKHRIIDALVNVDLLTGTPAVTELETIGKAIGEYAWKGLSDAASDINQFADAARDNKFTTTARYDAAYNAIIEKLAAILPEDAGTAKEAV